MKEKNKLENGTEGIYQKREQEAEMDNKVIGTMAASDNKKEKKYLL